MDGAQTDLGQTEGKVDGRRWDELCSRLGLPSSQEEYRRLVSAYSEPQRAYHTLQHLTECLANLDWARATGELEHADLAEMALWYHDAVYRPRASDNEAKSADWADEHLRRAGLDAGSRQRIRNAILDTRHAEKPADPLGQLVVDIDLAILGAGVQRFEEYEQQVRAEYAWVPWFLFKKKRRAFLEELAAAPWIYSTALFRQRFEERARENLERSVAALR